MRTAVVRHQHIREFAPGLERQLHTPHKLLSDRRPEVVKVKSRIGLGAGKSGNEATLSA